MKTINTIHSLQVPFSHFLAQIKTVSLLLSITYVLILTSHIQAQPQSPAFEKKSEYQDAIQLPDDFFKQDGFGKFKTVPPVTKAKSKQYPGEKSVPFQMGNSSEKVRVSAILSTGEKPLVPGQDAILAIRLKHQIGWHTHTHAPDWPDDSFKPIATAVTVKPQTGFTFYAQGVQWPKTESINVNFTGQPFEYHVYGHDAFIFLPFTVSANLQEKTYSITLQMTYQACNDRVCLPPVVKQQLILPIRVEAKNLAGDHDPKANADLSSLFAQFDARQWGEIKSTADQSNDPEHASSLTAIQWFSLLLTACAGGLLLNFTPCVLPVLPIKILSLTRSIEAAADEHQRTRFILHSGIMSIGIISFWMLIAGLLIGLRQFQTVNQLFTYGEFTITIGGILFVLGLSMMGLFTFTLPQWIYRFNPLGKSSDRAEKQSFSSSFLYGILTAILATPCAGPFMGTAIATSTQTSIFMTSLVFLAIGLGMSIPYFILAIFPALVDQLPRAGRGSELLKQVMGLLIIAGAIFFIGSGINTKWHDGQSAPSQWYWWLIGAVMVLSGVWLSFQSLKYKLGMKHGHILNTFGILLVLLGGLTGIVFGITKSSLWVYYTPEILEQAQAEKKIVVIDFTADWCLNCKALEKTVLNQPKVQKVLTQKRVLAMKVDLTSHQNQAGYQLLHELKRSTIPLVAILNSDGSAQAKMDFFTAEEILAAIKSAK